MRYRPFQFTPLREGRRRALYTVRYKPIFQFTPLREGRPIHPGDVLVLPYFNSRPCVRGD